MATGGVLLLAHDAVLDGFLDHLQGQTQGIRLLILRWVEPILHRYMENYHYFMSIKPYFKAIVSVS